MNATKPLPIRVREIVKIFNYPRAVWKVLAIEPDGTLHLTKLNSFERLDYRGVARERCYRAGGILA